jgi:peptide/nickel transport system substrate-binding protein
MINFSPRRVLSPRPRVRLLLASGLLVAGLAACGTADSDDPGEGEDPGDAEESTEDAEARMGGTLLVAGGPDVLYLDPAAAYSKGDYQIMRATMRALFDYIPSSDLEEGTTPVPDLAVEIPTEENGGISEDGTLYTIKLRDGVEWNAPDGPREVVASDAVLGLKRICNPVVGAWPRKYFADTIVGFKEYCDNFGSVDPTIEGVREYIESNDIEGMRAVDDKTLEFQLIQPAADFLEILAMGRFTAPHPVEYLDYLPDSPELRQNFISNGPYMITEYVPDQRFVLERNPTWDAETDDIRGAYVDRIEIAMGQEDSAVFQQIVAGTVDMQWGETTVPVSEIPALQAAEDDRLYIGGNGSIRPYITINTLSPNADGAFGKPEVRQALNFAVNKAAVQQILGGPQLAEIAHTIMPPEIPGNIHGENPLEVPDEGDAERARELLAEAGYPDGVPVKLLYEEEDPERDIATVLQQDLEEAGFQVELIPVTRNAFYGEWLLNKEVTETGGWDIAPTTWFADYFSGRAYMVPMLDGRGYESGSANYGGFNNDEVNSAIDRAAAATDPAESEAAWGESDRLATLDAAWVPITFTKTPTIHGDRVGNFRYHFPPNQGDFMNVWIEE